MEFVSIFDSPSHADSNFTRIINVPACVLLLGTCLEAVEVNSTDERSLKSAV